MDYDTSPQMARNLAMVFKSLTGMEFNFDVGDHIIRPHARLVAKGYEIIGILKPDSVFMVLKKIDKNDPLEQYEWSGGGSDFMVMKCVLLEWANKYDLVEALPL